MGRSLATTGRMIMARSTGYKQRDLKKIRKKMLSFLLATSRVTTGRMVMMRSIV